MREVRELWADAARLYDEPSNGLRERSRAAAWRGFAGGADWMRAAMSLLRGREPTGRARFGRLASAKYACASLAALLVLAALWRLPALALSAAVLAFYCVEARMLFVVPLALDGERAPFLSSHRLVHGTLGHVVATTRVMGIAALMLLGGLAGRGLLRSWCLGCLAVVLWYEDAQRAAAVRS